MPGITRRDALKLAGTALPAAALGAAPDAPKKHLILSCDGGGIRGLMTAKIIQRLNSMVPFVDKVDCYAGTSTGGIIALGLANKVTPDDLVTLYRKRGKDIFADGHETAPSFTDTLDASILRRILAKLGSEAQAFFSDKALDPRDLFRPRYPNTGLKSALTDILGDTKFSNVKSGKSVLVTALQLLSPSRGWAPVVFNNIAEAPSPNPRFRDAPTLDTTLVDAALCTSAAPLYFPPHEHPTLGYCIDGGMFANCPASIALGLALRTGQVDFRDISILSIGTGAQTTGVDLKNSKPFDKPEEYGALAWLDPLSRGEKLGKKERLTPAFPLVSALFDASSASHNYICSQAMGDNYFRVQVNLKDPVALDDADPDTLAFLESAPEKFIAQSDWDIAADWIRKRTG